MNNHCKNASQFVNSSSSPAIDWVFPTLRKPLLIWRMASSITVAAVGIFSKFLLGWMNRTKSYNTASFIHILEKRPRQVPLITVSNHHSCFDDPGMWGCLNLKQLLNYSRMRWSLAAHDICFTNKFHSYFFMLGKCIPCVRGRGVYQEAIEFCLEQLGKGQWVHVFPEGRVNMTKEFMRLKWGVGRMIYDSPVTPVVVPIWHIGMDEVLPNEPPYFLKAGKRLTFNFGEPIELDTLIGELRRAKATAEEARKAITDRIQDELQVLKARTELLHRKHYDS